MHYTLENVNYYSDHRVTSRESRWYKSLDEKRMVAVCGPIYDDELDHEYEGKEIKFTWDVCPTCEGRGRHVNPSIDCCGLSAADFAEDPDFAESYMRGDYDEPCYDCGGRRVVPVPDDEKFLNALESHYNALADMRAEYLAEVRMGA